MTHTLQRYDRVRTHQTGSADWLLVRAVTAETVTLVDADGVVLTVPVTAVKRDGGDS